MSWKKSNGSQYLYKKINNGQWKCLGVSSELTKNLFDGFRQGREDSKVRVNELKIAMLRRAAISKAVRINRFPYQASSIIRKISSSKLCSPVTIVGTHAIYAYESLAGVKIDPTMMETRDIDFMWDSRRKIELSSDNDSDFLNILQKSDSSFRKTKKSFRAANSDGFMVDLVTIRSKSMLNNDCSLNKNDLIPAEIGSLRWLMNSPRITVPVIDTKGFPLTIKVPDPRCFAVHKMWLSNQLDRAPDKAARDYHQALIVAKIVHEKLLQFPFSKDNLKMFPSKIFEGDVLDVIDGDFSI